MAKPTRKRRVKKNIESGIAHIHATFNNTIAVSYTHLDVYKRQILKQSSCLLLKLNNLRRKYRGNSCL